MRFVRGRKVIGGRVLLVAGVATWIAGCGDRAQVHASAPGGHSSLRIREQAYVNAAVRATRRLGGCVALGASQAEGGRIVTAPPDSALRSELAALNELAVTADSLPRAMVG